METKPLVYGLIGFFLGGLLVSVAATTFDAPKAEEAANRSMSQLIEIPQHKQGDKDFTSTKIEKYDKASYLYN